MLDQTMDTLFHEVTDQLAEELAGKYRYVEHWQRWYWTGMNGWDKQPIAEIEAALSEHQYHPTQAAVDEILELLKQDERILWKEPDD